MSTYTLYLAIILHCHTLQSHHLGFAHPNGAILDNPKADRTAAFLRTLLGLAGDHKNF